MKVHFCQSKGIGAWFIRFMTFSRWSHVAIEVGPWVYDSTGPSGVRLSSYEDFAKGYDVIESVQVKGTEQKAKEFLNNQLGKKYDWFALIALPFRASWQNPHRWFCSELVAKALVHAGVMSLPYKTWRVTPRDLYTALWFVVK